MAAITSLITHYKIEIQDEPQFKYETFEERKSRILKTQLRLTVSCVDPVQLAEYWVVSTGPNVCRSSLEDAKQSGIYID